MFLFSMLKFGIFKDKTSSSQQGPELADTSFLAMGSGFLLAPRASAAGNQLLRVNDI